MKVAYYPSVSYNQKLKRYNVHVLHSVVNFSRKYEAEYYIQSRQLLFKKLLHEVVTEECQLFTFSLNGISNIDFMRLHPHHAFFSQCLSSMFDPYTSSLCLEKFLYQLFDNLIIMCDILHQHKLEKKMKIQFYYFFNYEDCNGRGIADIELL